VARIYSSCGSRSCCPTPAQLGTYAGLLSDDDCYDLYANDDGAIGNMGMPAAHERVVRARRARHLARNTSLSRRYDDSRWKHYAGHMRTHVIHV
jgi:hypothetical protein